ncbi:hypothetical protein PI95_026610 [Hassallia byssoidea VB512170]|uniref:Uncharacterized protein n=1 Tax=Hassallia byssoidea VB512170 TaxID=1304833 RepID=A0A846HGS4_9CYAN|nr:hypothetical protein [Hassalia byssoidea]NEU76029.1 hypothetical protein [Hassalia byssoidea VB512170]
MHRAARKNAAAQKLCGCAFVCIAIALMRDRVCDRKNGGRFVPGAL